MIPKNKILPVKHLHKQTEAEYWYMFSLFFVFSDAHASTIQQMMIQHFGQAVGLNWIRYRRRQLGLNTIPVGYPRGKSRTNPLPDSLNKRQAPKPVLQDCAGLLILEELFRQYVQETLYQILMELDRRGETPFPVGWVEKLRDLLLIFGSGKVKRLSQYEPGMIEGVRYSPDTLLEFLDQLASFPGLDQVWNEAFLGFWIQFLDSKGLWDGWIFLDGHGKPYFSKSSMLCGKVSASDRIMPITKSVMVHQRLGLCIWYESTPPNTHYGETFFNLAVQIQSFLSKNGWPAAEIACTDREGNSKQKGQAYSGKGLLHLSCLKSNEYKGLDDFEFQMRVGEIHVGYWREETKRKADPRTFVLKYHVDHWVAFSVAGATTPGQALGITSQYRDRQEVQENAIKEQKSQLAFDVNYGNKRTAEFEVPTKAAKKQAKKLEKKLKRIKQRQAQLAKQCPKQKRSKEKQVSHLEAIQGEICAVEKELNTLPQKRVRDRDRRKDDRVALIKLLVHNLVLVLGVLVDWHGLSPRRTEKMNRYILRRSGYLEEYEGVTMIYLLPPHRLKTREEIRNFIQAFNKTEFRRANGKWLRLNFVGET